jgi:hypothetical protein
VTGSQSSVILARTSFAARPLANRRCSWRWAGERAEAFAGAHVHRAVLHDPPQLNAIR